MIAAVVGTGLIAAPAALLHLVSEKPAAANLVYNLDKLRVVTAPTLASADLVDTAVLVGVIVLLWMMFRFRALRLSQAGKPALAALLVVILVLPNQIDKAIDVDSRLVIFPVFVSLALLEFWPPTARARAVTGAAIFALITLQVGNVLAVGHDYEEQVSEFRAAAGQIMPGEKVLMAEDTRTTADCTQAPTELPSRRILTHIGSYLTIDRKAFVPLNFADPGMQPIRPIGEYAQISARPSVPVPVWLLKFAADPNASDALRRVLSQRRDETYFLEWPRKFDAVVILHHGCGSNPLPDKLAVIGSGRFFTMYRIPRE